MSIHPARTAACLLALALAWTMPSARAQDDAAEVQRHVEALRKQYEDRSLTAGQRERFALEAAATLDRAAQASTDQKTTQTLYSQAVKILDDFTETNPDHPRHREFGFQSAVYLWAQARSMLGQIQTNPGTDPALAEQGAGLLDQAILRLKKVEGSKFESGDALDQNVRFRLAQAIADRVTILPGEALADDEAERQAIELLNIPSTEPGLRSFALLLKAQLLTRRGRRTAPADHGPDARTSTKLKQADRDAMLVEALRTLDLAQQNEPPPPAFAALEARVEVLLAQSKFAEAQKLAESAKGNEAARASLLVHVRLAELATLAPTDANRKVLEAAAIQLVGTLQGKAGPDARRARIDVSRAIERLDDSATPEMLRLLGECHQAAGSVKLAADLTIRAAEKAAGGGQKEEARSLWMRAGAILFQAGDFAEAVTPFAAVADDPEAGASRPKASLLRALALGRGVAASQAGCSPERYQAVLKEHLKSFPDDPSSSEASWLLAQFERAQGRADEAVGLLEKLRPGSPRWLDARRAIVEILQSRLDSIRLAEDRSTSVALADRMRTILRESLDQTRDNAQRIALETDLVRLELTPDVGSAEAARRTADRILAAPGSDQLHRIVQQYRVVALARLNRMIEAEQSCREVASRSTSDELLKLANLLDQSATVAESEVSRRRFGMLMGLALERVMSRYDKLPPAQQVEAQLRNGRALLLSGNVQSARKSFASVASAESLTDAQLRDLADAYDRLDAQELVVDVQRLRSRRQPTGSVLWFDSRYGQALAYYRAGRPDEARQLIDATAILHPELGGAELKSKFERLRQRLDSK